MNNLRIKIAGLSDVDVIYSLDQEYENETYSKELILGSLSNNKDLSLIAYIDDIPVGYIAYEVVLNEAELLKVVVSKDARRMGIGKHLLQQSLLVLKNKNVDSVFLEVRKSNKPL